MTTEEFAKLQGRILALAHYAGDVDTKAYLREIRMMHAFDQTFNPIEYRDALPNLDTLESIAKAVRVFQDATREACAKLRGQRGVQ